MTQDPQAPAAHAERIALISTQRLFAETLGAQVRAARGSEIVVLDGRHPDLLQACRHAEPVLFLLDIGNWSVPGLTLLSHLIDQLPETPVLVLGDADSDDFGEVVD